MCAEAALRERGVLNGPVGLFDSGVGGLSVLKAVRHALPDERLLVLADHAHAPYGEQTPAAIQARTLRIGHWLVQQGCRAVVVACNTATAVAVDALRQALHGAVPVVGIEPAVKPAAQWTRRGVIGVLATTATVASGRLAQLCDAHARPLGVQVLMLPGPGLVEQVEAGDLDGPATRALLAQHLAPMQAAGADVLVLGCTHYPFLAPALRAVLGDGVRLLDPAEAVARELARRLGGLPVQPAAAASAVPRGAPQAGQVRLLTTGDAAAVQAVVLRLWPEAPQVEALRGV